MENPFKKAQQTQGVRPDDQEAPKAVTYTGANPNLPKGARINPTEKLSQGILVADTGAYTEALDPFREQETFSPEQIDQVYLASINAGVVDHHSIDMLLGSKGVDSRKCSTRMVADYPEAILALIKDKGLSQVETHKDSDLDAIASSYLIRSLIEHGKLPRITEDLATVTNKEDYGENHLDPETYVKSLAGTVSSIKDVLGTQARAALGKEVFGNPAVKDANGRLTNEGVAKMNELNAYYENLRNKYVFDLLNALEAAKAKDPNFDVQGDISNLELAPELAQVITAGRESMQKTFAEFLTEFESAEKGKMTVRNKQGGEMEVDVIVGSSKKPLVFTNMAYLRTRPETIVACYAGADRFFGDSYDIGITQDMANTIDLEALWLALTKAERAKRDQILSKPENERSEAEQKLVSDWSGQPDREAFGGLFAKISSGAIAEEDILRKDPTVLVSGGSLIAASRTSLINEEEFRAIFESVMQK